MAGGRIAGVAVLVAAGFALGFGYGRWYGPRSGSGPTASAAKQAKGFHCPMHPNFRSDHPGDCGICGMKLVPDEVAGQPEPSTGMAEMPPGTVHISADKQQLIGVTYGVVESGSGTQTLRATGKVMMDETRMAKVQSRIDGWVDKVYADFVGKAVTKGQPLLTLYSPELLASQQEYLLALRSRDIMRNSTLPGSKDQSESLIAAARRRLELFDLSPEQIDEVTRTGKAITNITLNSPVTGFVMERNAFPKQRITPETELYTVADLTRVWILADVYEVESQRIQIGMPVTLSLPYNTGRPRQGRVNYIQPQVDAESRAMKVRIEAENPGMMLRPDMFVDVEFRMRTGAKLSVPSGAVLDSGMRKTVFVDLGDGFLEPRQVETGDRVGQRVEIRKGLKAGERVVTSGNFLIDSESQLRSAASGGTPAAAEHKHD